MEATEKLLLSFDKSSEQFSSAWKKAREKASEKSIHDLRVSTRRLISTLEISGALSKTKDTARLQKRLKKIIKNTGLLRDVQVQLSKVSELHRAQSLADFVKTVKRKERREIKAARTELKRSELRRFEKAFQRSREEFVRLHKKLGDGRIRGSLDRVLRTRQNEFQRTWRRFDPTNDDSLHKMRIALKKFRYTVEAAQPVLGAHVKKEAREMHAFQQLMGDTRDIQLLREALEKWASKKGKTIAAAPIVDQLHEQRRELLRKVEDSTSGFGRIFAKEQKDQLKPAIENTQVALPADAPDAAFRVKPAND